MDHSHLTPNLGTNMDLSVDLFDMKLSGKSCRICVGSNFIPLTKCPRFFCLNRRKRRVERKSTLVLIDSMKLLLTQILQLFSYNLTSNKSKSTLVPKSGEWDVNDPSANGYFVIFNKIKDEKGW